MALPAATAVRATPYFTPTFDYLRALGASALSAHAPRSPLLCILDLNGVLLERLSAKSGKNTGLHRAARALRAPNFRIDSRDVWLRPFHAFFLSYISRRHNLAVWSSATPKTVQGLLWTTPFLDGSGVGRGELAFVRDRETCIPDTAIGGHATRKPLAKIWEDARLEGRWHAGNSVIFDDSQSKVVADLDNAIICPEYAAQNMRIDYLNDETLLWTAMYLEHICLSPFPLQPCHDIRERVRDTPSLADFILSAQAVAITHTSSPSCRTFIPAYAVPSPIHSPPVAIPVPIQQQQQQPLSPTHPPQALAEQEASDAAQDGPIPARRRLSRSARKHRAASMARERALATEEVIDVDAEEVDDAEDAGISSHAPHPQVAIAGRGVEEALLAQDMGRANLSTSPTSPPGAVAGLRPVFPGASRIPRQI